MKLKSRFCTMLLVEIDRLNTVVIVVVVVVLAILLGLGAIIFGCKQYQRWKREAGRIRIPESDVLNDQNAQHCLLPIGNNSYSALPGYYSPEIVNAKLEECDRTYSVGDITEVLEGDFKQPDDIDTYLLAELSSDKANGHKVAGAVNIYGEKPPSICERDGAIYVDRHDKVKDKPDHCGDSISSLLSDAHTEVRNFSIEDLREDQNALAQSLKVTEQGLESPLSPLDSLCTSKDKHNGKTIDSRKIDNAAITKEGNDFAGSTNVIKPEILPKCDESKLHESSKSGTSKITVENMEKTSQIEKVPNEPSEIDPVYPVSVTEANGMENQHNLNNWDNEQWNFANGFNFDDSLGDHYNKVIDIDSEDTMIEESKSDMSVIENEIPREDSSETASTIEHVIDDLDNNQKRSHLNSSKNEELDSPGLHGNGRNVHIGTMDQIRMGSLHEGGTEKHSSEINMEDIEQTGNKLADKHISNNSNGFISGISESSSNSHKTPRSCNSSKEHQQSNCLDNSGKLQSYMKAHNDTFKVSKHDLHPSDIKDGKKHNLSNENRKITGTEPLHINKTGQECR